MSLKPLFIRCNHVTDSSSIIKDIQDMCPTGLAILAIFYFHFGDSTKQDARNLLSSILFQLCSQSDKLSQVLSSIYLSHGNGSREPSIDTLLECLKTILGLHGQAPLYIVVDALDECPNSSGLRTQRQEVLEIVKELIDLKLPYLHFCVTSRPEIDIRRAFDPLNSYNVSLHDQDGQIKDLAEYIKSVVGSDATMQDWPSTVKELVIDTLTKKGGRMYVIMVLTPSIPFSCVDFRFRWAYCQLEILRQCPLRYISSTLDELPETLDETYERILQGIPKKMKKDAHRIFQWIMVSSRPLRVEEVAEVFAINFDEEMSGIPKFEPRWRDPNAETAVLSACSTLVAIVDDGWPRKKRVQFSHFSVKEYLTSDRIANAEHVSHFHIHPKPAHTLLAKACLSVLFQLDYSMDKAEIKTFRLAKYAAEHWVEHARFEDVSSYIRDGMDLLFEKDKPHFAIWVWVYNMDEYCEEYFFTDVPGQPDAVPLYYAALCGFRGLVERLLTAHPQDLNAKGGDWGSPLNAALAKGHQDIALFLLGHGADGEDGGNVDQTGLYIASSRGYADVVRSLIDRGAGLNAICKDYDEYHNDKKWTPLHVAIYKERRDIAILLLERGADTEIPSRLDQTALYMASSRGYADVVRSLIDRGADLNTICEDCDEGGDDMMWTPLHVAIYKERQDIAILLLERGANTVILSRLDQTALYMASSRGYTDVVRSLIDRGADLDAICKDYDEDGNDVKWTPLHEAIYQERRDIANLLLERGADTETRSSRDETALYMASSRRCADVVRQLISHGADLNAECQDTDVYWDDVKWTPLHVAIRDGIPPIARMLLEHGANPKAPDNLGKTALHVGSSYGQITEVDLLLEYGANVDVRDKKGWTPLHEAAYRLRPEVVVVLLNHGADPHAQNNWGETPMQLANEPHSWVSTRKQDQAQIIGLLSERTGERM